MLDVAFKVPSNINRKGEKDELMDESFSSILKTQQCFKCSQLTAAVLNQTSLPHICLFLFRVAQGG